MDRGIPIVAHYLIECSDEWEKERGYISGGKLCWDLQNQCPDALEAIVVALKLPTFALC
jgi:hypothetical protein